MKPKALAVLSAVAVFCLPALALACPVCGAAQNDANQRAFVGSTIFLSLLPLAMMGGLAAWGLWRVRKQAEERKSEDVPRDSSVQLRLEPRP
ncbi:MAG: hypothetical protein U0263_10430 [Polyangiaceae bacterium]